MSSRNTRLSVQGKEEAANLHLVLEACKEKYPHFSPSELADWATHSLNVLPNTRVEYVAFADASSLRPVGQWNESEHIRVLIAAWVEDVRLIDNALLF
jgi:pantoate--beta-alanine ligase